LAKTHRSLTFDELCEEAFGEIGLHPWEFYEYSLIEYLQKRKGASRKRKDDYRQMLVASMLPYMKKEERARIVTNAFREEGAKVISLRERYEAIKKRFQDAGELNFNNGQ
jgi:hypothetical protein